VIPERFDEVANLDHSHGGHDSRIKANASPLSACRCLR
jgi:hypothetical protein